MRGVLGAARTAQSAAPPLRQDVALTLPQFVVDCYPGNLRLCHGDSDLVQAGHRVARGEDSRIGSALASVGQDPLLSRQLDPQLLRQFRLGFDAEAGIDGIEAKLFSIGEADANVALITLQLAFRRFEQCHSTASQALAMLWRKIGVRAKCDQADIAGKATQEECLTRRIAIGADDRNPLADHLIAITDGALSDQTSAHLFHRPLDRRQAVTHSGRQDDVGCAIESALDLCLEAPLFLVEALRASSHGNHLEVTELFAHPLQQVFAVDAAGKGRVVAGSGNPGGTALPTIDDDDPPPTAGKEDARGQTCRPAADDETADSCCRHGHPRSGTSGYFLAMPSPSRGSLDDVPPFIGCGREEAALPAWRQAFRHGTLPPPTAGSPVRGES